MDMSLLVLTYMELYGIEVNEWPMTCSIVIYRYQALHYRKECGYIAVRPCRGEIRDSKIEQVEFKFSMAATGWIPENHRMQPQPFVRCSKRL